MVPKAVRVWTTRDMFSFPLQMRRLSVCVQVCGLCGCFSVCAQWTEPCPSQVFGHRCSAQPPCLLPVLFNVFYFSLLALTPWVPHLASPDRVSQSQIWVLWDGTGGLVPPGSFVLWVVLALFFHATFSLSVPSFPVNHTIEFFTYSM